MNPSTPKSRRAFLFKLSVLLNGAVGAVLAVPIVGYILGPALRKGSSYNSWVALGAVNDFPEGETRLVDYRNPVTTSWDGETGKVACWVRRISGEQFQVFAINCAHLGCPVRWFAQSKLFLCPCHGGAYYAGWISRLGTTAARLIRIQAQDRRESVADQRRRDADPGHRGLQQETADSN